MAWFKLDDQGAFHPKVMKAGNEAYGAWCRAGQWCMQHLTDGRIPVETAHAIAPPRAWQRLIAAGLVVLDGDEYEIHDFLKYNPSAAQVRAERERKQRNLRDFRGRSRNQHEASDDTEHETGFTPGIGTGIKPDENHGPDPDPPFAYANESPVVPLRQGALIPVSPTVTDADLEAVYRRYPRKEGKTKGMQTARRQIKTPADLADFGAAVDRYAREREGEESQFTKQFSTFVNCWRDYAPTAEDREQVAIAQAEANRRAAAAAAREESGEGFNG
jgi:hypothetical protein